MSNDMIAEADRRVREAKDAASQVPAGLYCYSRTETGKIAPCPFWATHPDKRGQESGYCALLKAGDWQDKGPSLLWDMVKECGINDADAEE